MGQSRRKSTAGSPVARAAKPASARSLKPAQVVKLFANLPGDVAFKISAPRAKRKAPFVAELNSSRMLFVASAIKTFVLCEALRQADSANIDDDLEHVPI